VRRQRELVEPPKLDLAHPDDRPGAVRSAQPLQISPGSGEQEVLRHLLRDGGGALRAAAGAVVLRIGDERARDAGEVDAAVLVEVLVLGCQERVDDQFWNRLDRQIQPAFLGIFSEQRSIRCMDASHHRRLIILKLGIIRQILGKMPDEPCRGGDAHQKHDGSGGEQETHEPHQKTHYRSSVSAIAP
jgi:hypothetical protein